MNIAIIGAGNVGGALGRVWAKKGHSILFGARNPADEKVTTLVSSIGANARATTVPEAAAGSEVVVLTVPWDAAQDAVRSAGDLSGKVVIDVTNPLGSGFEGLQRGLVLGQTTSGAEQVASWASGARVVKAFNQTGWENMADSHYTDGAICMFVCGDDADAKRTATKLGEDLGFEMIDAGALKAARLLEPVAMLWINLAVFGGMGTGFAFKLIKRQNASG
ncbi:MAG: NADPH-dependent F420 reductase [Armatimonadota bacterium]|nr:NADPH-dependent F420 reductase [Armatimonadota bacterium]